MIDREHLALQTAGDELLQRDLLVLLDDQLQDLDHLLASVAPSGSAMPGRGLDEACHRMRGAAAAVGAAALVAALARTEAQLVAGELSTRSIDDLRRTVGLTRAEVRRLFAAPPPGGLAKGGESH